MEMLKQTLHEAEFMEILEIMKELSPEERNQTALLMGYAPETAGRIMTTEYVYYNQKTLIKDALENLRTIAKDKETIYILYVTNDKRKLEGVITGLLIYFVCVNLFLSGLL